MSDYFNYSTSDIKDTELQLVTLEDTRTGIKITTAISNPGLQTPSIMAFSGARYSRSADSIVDIYKEVRSAGSNAQEKLANIFRKYGHASVADMAQLFIYIENVPQITACKFFNETSIGGGQERSTRYQDFGNLQIEDIHKQLPIKLKEDTKKDIDYKDLNQKYKFLQEYSLEKYAKWKKILTKEYTRVYKVDISQKSQKSSLTARVFDSARAFLLSGLGNRTSLAWITSAREWARIISFFKAENLYLNQCLGEQIEAILAPAKEICNNLNYLPEAPDLIQYTSADESCKNTLNSLYTYFEELGFANHYIPRTEFERKKIQVDLLPESLPSGVKVIVNLILSLYPKADPEYIFTWLKSLDNENINKLSSIAFSDFNHHSQMSQSYRVNSWTYRLTCTFAEARDLNRHRAWGRSIPMLNLVRNYQDILSHGYALPLYIDENPDFSNIKKEFVDDLEGYYSLLRSFIKEIESKHWFDKTLILQLLPFAHIAEMWMHASPKEVSYMTKLRVRPGGHINYRMLAYQIAKQTKSKNYLMSGLDLPQKPNPISREEFLDRS